MTIQLIFLPTSSLLSKQGSSLPALQRLLATGRHLRRSEPVSALLCSMLGMRRQLDWPVAALSWLGDGGTPAADYWLCADPVHFALQRDHFSLSEPVPLPLSRQQAQSLLQTLNQHFTADGLRFYLGESNRCYLQLQAPPQIRTTTPETALHRDVSAFLPQGDGALKWKRILNEAQMLLHGHAVNQAREANGHLPVNSLWLWGGGVLPEAAPEADPMTVFGSQSLARGLAMWAQLPHYELPGDAEALLKHTTSDILLVLHDAHEAERKWFAPLLGALKAGKIDRLVMHFAVRDQLLSVSISPLDLWKFWRKPRAAESYFMAEV